MPISLTLRFRATLVISLIALACPRRCTSHPQESPNKKSGSLQIKSTPTSRLDKLWTRGRVGIVSHVIPIPKPAAFLANISIGDPPVPQLLLIDTGSDLTWIQCLPERYASKNPFFHTPRSSSYPQRSCKSAPYAIPRLTWEGNTGTCQYYLRYRDLSSTRGVLAKEKLTFQTSDHGVISKSNIVFGCGQDNTDSTQYSGVLGLGPGKFSLVTRNFDSMFSYRFGSLTDPTYPHNILILGKGAKTEGHPTPLQIYQDRYYLDLQEISFGENY